MLIICYKLYGAKDRQNNIELSLLAFAAVSFLYVLAVLAAGIDVVNLISPTDNEWINGTNDTIAFTFNYTGENWTASCELFIDGTLYFLNDTVFNETDTAMYANDTLDEGTHTWNVNCTNVTTINSAMWTLNIDRTAPSVTLIAPEDNYNTTQASLDFQFNATDTVAATLNCSLYINSVLETYNATTGNGTDTNMTGALSEGTSQAWTVNCTDTIGHYHQPAARTFNVDSTPPSLAIHLPQATNYSSNESLELNYSVSDGYQTDSCWYNVDGAPNTTVQDCSNTTFSVSGGGTFTLYLYANDSLDNTNNTESVTFAVDLTDPAPSFGTDPANNSNESSPSVTFELSCYDNTGVDTVQLWSDWTGPWSMNQTNSSYMNDTIWSVQVDGIPEGTWLWAVWCNDTSGRSGWTGTNRTLNVDITPPSVSITYPDNTTYYNVTYFNFTLSETADACWYDAGSGNTTFSCGNGTPLCLTEGQRSLEVYANDSAGSIGGGSIAFTLDQTEPEYSALTQNTANSSAYDPSYQYQFNSTWTDSAGMDTVLLEWGGTNHTASNISSLYNYSMGGLAAGNYSYRWCGNDTLGNLNCTQTYTYEVAKASVSVINSFSPSPPITYGTPHTPSCHVNVSSLSPPVTQERNGTGYTNDTAYTLAAGDYNYTCTFPGNDNYTSAYDQDTFTIDRATTGLDILTSPASPTVYGTDVTPACYHNNTDISPQLFVNGTTVTNSTPISLQAGTHNISCNVSQSENFTYALNYTIHEVSRASNDLTITGTGTFTYPYQSSVDCSASYGSPYLYRNGTLISAPPDVNTLGFGTYNYSCNITQSENYTANLTYEYLDTQQNTSNPLFLHLNGSRDNLIITFGQSVNATGYVLYAGGGTADLYVNVTPDSNPYVMTPGAGTYVFTANTTGNENYTANSTGETFWLFVNKADTEIELYHNETLWTTTYTFTVPETVVVNGTINVSVLQGDVSCLFNGSSSSNPNSTHYVSPTYLNWSCSYSGSYNYSSSSNEQSLNASDATIPVVTITYPSNKTYYNTTHFNFTLVETNPDSCWYTTDGGTTNTTMDCTNGTILSLTEDPHLLEVYANDSAGSIGGGSIAFTLDQTEPEITIDSPGNITYPSQTIYFNVSLNENASWCGYSLDGMANESMVKLSDTYFWDLNVTMSDGTHNVTFYCNDTVNNLNATTEYFTVDTDIPSLAITYPANTTYYNATYYNFTFTKTTDTCWYRLNGGINTTVSCGNSTGISGTEGQNTLEAYANDSLNNIAGDIEYFTNDWSHPVVSLLYPVDNYNTSQTSIDFRFNVTDNVSTTFNCSLFINDTLITYNGSTLNSTTTNFTVPVSVTLDQNWTINCTDEGGNSNQSALRTFSIDQTPPSVNMYLPQPTNYSDNNTIPLNYTVADTLGIQSCWYNVGGGTNYTISGCGNTTFNTTGEGTFTVYLYVNDTSGNINNTEYATFDIDMTPPSVSITYPLNTTYYNITHFNFSASDQNPDSCWYNTDGSTNETIPGCQNSTLLSLSEGTQTLEVYANDSAGNIGADAVYLTLDQTGPVITFQLPTPDNQTTTANYTYINLTISESGYCLLDWNGTDESMSNATQSETYFVNKTFVTNGNYTFTAWCNDTLGNLNQSEMRWVYINWTVPPPPDLTPPIVNIIAPANDTTANKTLFVQFGEVANWSAYSIDGGINISQGAVSYIYFEMATSDGPHNITIYANDSSGNMNSSTRHWIQDTTPPDIYNVTNESITAISAVIRWNTTEDANSSVSYGTAVSMLNESSSSASLTQGHGLTIQVLVKNTTYYYNVTSCDGTTNCNTSGPRSFLTCMENWSCSSWSSCSGGTQTRTCNDLNSCDSTSERPALSQSCDDGGGSNGGTTSSSPQNVTSRPELVPGVGIINNTRLQDAIEMVLQKANLSGTAQDRLMRLSESITQNVSAERNMYFSGTTTKLSTVIRYTGQKKIRNFMIFEKVPKLFASSAGIVNITAHGAIVRIVEEDPSWLITWPEVTPGDDLSIIYETSGKKSSTIPDSTETEIYAESVEEISDGDEANVTENVSCKPSMLRCHGDEVQLCSSSGDAWTVLEICTNGCDSQTLSCALEPAGERPGIALDMTTVIAILVVLAFAVIVVIGVVSLRGGKKKPKKQAGKEKKKPLLHRPEEISKDIAEGEPDVAIASVEIGMKASVKKHLKKTARKISMKSRGRKDGLTAKMDEARPELPIARIEIIEHAKPKSVKKRLERVPGKLALKMHVTKKPEKTVKKEMPQVTKKIPRYIIDGEPDIVMSTLSDIHRLVKKKHEVPKKITDTDANVKKIGRVAYNIPKMRLNLEALMGDTEEHEETVADVRKSEDSLHNQVEEITNSLSVLKSHLAEKMKKKKLEEKETDDMLEKTSRSLNTKVNIMSRNLDDALDRLGRRIDESSKVGKLQMESNIGYLKNQIEELRSDMPKYARKKDIEKTKKKRVKKEDSPEEAQPSEKEIAKAVPLVRMPADEPKEEITDEKVRISDLRHFKGKDVIMEVELELTKTVEEDGTKMYGYNLKDETGEVMLTSTSELNEGKQKIKSHVNETGKGKIYLRFVSFS